MEAVGTNGTRVRYNCKYKCVGKWTRGLLDLVEVGRVLPKILIDSDGDSYD